MKKTVLSLLITLATLPVFAWTVPAEIEPIEAPFEMPQLQRPVFPDAKLYITKTGAKKGKPATAAIQKAIDRLAAKGGGTVVVPAGEWLTGRITLKSNVCLHLEEGAVLQFSGAIADYLPVVPCRNEGVDILSLGAMVYANGAENIGLTGKGRLVAPPYDCEVSSRQESGISADVEKLPFEERVFDGADGHNIFLPQFFGVMNCKNILVEGVTFDHSIFWNIVPTYSENIIIRDVTVNSHGHGRTDGIDIDSSVNALIEYVTLDCGDDCFTLKSGRGNDGVDRARPTRNVVIRHCAVKRGVGGVTIGTETAAGIENVFVKDVTMERPMYPFYFKTRRPRGGGADHVWVEDVTIMDSGRATFFWDMLGSATYVGELAERFPARPIGKLTPRFGTFRFKNIDVRRSPLLVRAKGIPEQPIDSLIFENITSPANQTISLQDVGTFDFNK